MLSFFSVAGHSADPGNAYPAASELSDQKVGSVLIYNLYISGAASPATQNTRFSIVNTSTASFAYVHLFFVSSGGAVADSFICLTQVQTASFLASDVDPGTQGYLVAVAVDGVTGCPTGFNFLSGDAYIKQSAGFEASLPAEAFAAQFSGVMPGCNPLIPSATLFFDNSSSGYNRAPRMLAVEKLRSPADGNLTQIVINRVGGNLMTGVSTIGTLAGVLYDDLANPVSFAIFSGPQLFGTLSDTFPAPTSPVFSAVIPAGRTGWMKFSNQTADVGVLGAVLNFNSSSGLNAGAFTGGHNMRKLTLSNSNNFIIPVFPPSC